MVRLFKFVAFLCFVSLSNGNPWVEEMVKSGQRTLVQCRRRTGAFEQADEDFGDSVMRMKDCLRSEFVDSLDDLVASPEIPITDYVSLIGSNITALESTGRSNPDDDLLTTVTNKMYAIIDTHSFKLNLGSFDGADAEGQVEGRQRRIRRRFRRAFPMVVAGFIIMAAILIPPGFQFMAIVTSKALMIAKLAFIMAVAGHYRSMMADLNFHHQEILHHGTPNSLQLRPGELPGGSGIPAALLGAAAGSALSNPGLTGAYSLGGLGGGLGGGFGGGLGGGLNGGLGGGLGTFPLRRS